MHENEVMWRCDDPDCSLADLRGHSHINISNLVKVAERLVLAGKANRGETVTAEEWAAVGINA